MENPIDFEVANHFTATHPNSLFMNAIIASAVTPDGRVNVMNRDVTYLREDTAIEAQLPESGTGSSPPKWRPAVADA